MALAEAEDVNASVEAAKSAFPEWRHDCQGFSNESYRRLVFILQEIDKHSLGRSAQISFGSVTDDRALNIVPSIPVGSVTFRRWESAIILILYTKILVCESGLPPIYTGTIPTYIFNLRKYFEAPLLLTLTLGCRA
jgi:hypothetical protein